MDQEKEVDSDLIEQQAEMGNVAERSLRWLADGATTLGEVIARVRQYADYLAQLKLRGWELIDEVDNLYMFLQNPAYPIGDPDDE